MPEKREAQAHVFTDAHGRVVGKHGGLFNGVGAEIGEFATLQVSPLLFDRSEVVSVRRQPFADEPAALGREELLHLATAMRGKSVPDERRPVIFQMFAECRDELNHRRDSAERPELGGKAVGLRAFREGLFDLGELFSAEPRQAPGTLRAATPPPPRARATSRATAKRSLVTRAVHGSRRPGPNRR